MIVRDTGSGIEDSIRGSIFAPYFTTKEEGAGLGLSTVRGIVKNHGGIVRVQSELGTGTSVSVLMPLSRLERVDNELSIEKKDAAAASLILFVDDEEIIRHSTGANLRRLGYDVVTCSSGEEALGLFGENPNRFDVIVTDQTMPKLTGTELARGAREIRDDIPIILCTGYTEGLDEEQALAIGMSGFLMKPFHPLEIANLIDRITRRRAA